MKKYILVMVMGALLIVSTAVNTFSEETIFAKSLAENHLGSGLAFVEPGALTPQSGPVVFLSDSNTLCNSAPGVWCCLIHQNETFLLNLFGAMHSESFTVGSLNSSRVGMTSFSEGQGFSAARNLLLENYKPVFAATETITDEFLAGVDVFVYCPASTSISGYRILTQEEVDSIFNFVLSGGYLLVLGDNTSFDRYGYAYQLNNVISEPFGVEYNGTIGGYYTLYVGDTSSHEILNSPFGAVDRITQCYPGAMSFHPKEKPIVTVSVSLDIKPGSCQNPVNVGKKGVTPIAVVGTSGLDVSNIDPTTLRISGVEPLRWSFEDVTSSSGSQEVQENASECANGGPDGEVDLDLKFDTASLVEAVASQLGRQLVDGEVLTLSLTGSLYPEFGGSMVEGQDVMTVINKKK